MKPEESGQRNGRYRYNSKCGGDSKFVEGFANTSLAVCVCAIEDGINSDASMLPAKSVLDCVIVLIFAGVLTVLTGQKCRKPPDRSRPEAFCSVIP